ncbi:hypothetical protein SORBI_3001G094100 [Sorghum bicolor]|uniref:Uncharacterized protein n=1 Tax=Sorghum bicolor TaxID=4558 RepID=A0A1B6QI46_SORBI|nr:hypothetical protein SORBI_3001G094100 [Sorghum bicolor]
MNLRYCNDVCWHIDGLSYGFWRDFFFHIGNKKVLHSIILHRGVEYNSTDLGWVHLNHPGFFFFFFFNFSGGGCC